MKKQATDTQPWWKYGHLWLVISGPAIVVVAALVTGYIAMRYADPVIDANYYQDGLKINKILAAQNRAHLPAEQGRNHAATPAEP